jgi:hypothetical protein
MPTRLDLTGRVYDELTVIEMLYNYNNKHRTYCRCQTINGDEVIVRADALRSGSTHCAKGAGKSGKPLDITGRRYGLLQAVRPTNKKASNGSVIWECKCNCGNNTEVPVSQLIRKHTLSCGCRHQSKWEMFIGDYLTDLHIDFVAQKRFSDCMNAQGTDTLPFDFFIPSYNVLIEYDGEHHFQPISGWGGEAKFKITQQNDCIKNNYCQTHNITLLRLPYTYTEDDIKMKILNILSPVTITA